MKSVILSNAASVMLFHNHPSGCVQPSKEDINLTGRIKEVLELIDIGFLDHVIIGADGRYFSFRDNNMIPVSQNKVWDSEESKFA